MDAPSGENLWGLRAFGAGGFPSGKGLWDWMDTEDSGTLHFGGGGGGGILYNRNFGEYQLESGIIWATLSGRQHLGKLQYKYEQSSLEIPLLLKHRLPFRREIYLGAGGDLIFIPLKSRRTVSGDSEESEGKPMLALQTGFDYSLYETGPWSLWLSAYFVHPLSSPEYSFEKESSGNIRINRFDLGLTFLYRGRNNEN